MESEKYQIICPLTKASNIKKILEIDSNLIINKYKNEINIDINRFFKKYKLISLYKCNDTGYKFYYPFTSIGDKEFYEDLSRSRLNYYSNRWEHKKALKFIESNESVIEIGSGFGAFLKLLKENKIKSKGLELNPHAVENCKNEGLNVQEILIQEEIIINRESYDVVCYFQVLEHIVEVNNFIESSIAALKKGGKLIIGVPNNNPYLFINDRYHTLNLPPHHAGLWNKKSLKSLEKLFPLKIKKMEYEPLESTYGYFINFQINNASNIYFKKGLNVLNKLMPKLLKKIVCKFIKGRNVLAVYEKTE